MRRLLGGVLAAFMTTTVLILPAPAHATAYVHEAESDLDAGTNKGVTVTCPEYHHVFGLGGRVRHGDGSVALTAVFPNADRTSVTAIARARPGYAGTWSVVASAVCLQIGSTPELATGLGRGSSAAIASCPGDTIVYGAGYQLISATPYEYVDAVVPNEALSSVYVHAGGVTSSTATLVAYALCGYPVEHARSGKTVPLDPGLSTTGTAPEPEGFNEHYGWVSGAGVQSNLPGMFIEGFGPNSNLDGAKANMARAKPATPFARMASAADEDDEEMTVYATGIGSWYSSPS